MGGYSVAGKTGTVRKIGEAAEPPVLGRMRDKLAQVEADPEHMWHPLLRG